MKKSDEYRECKECLNTEQIVFNRKFFRKKVVKYVLIFGMSFLITALISIPAYFVQIENLTEICAVIMQQTMEQLLKQDPAPDKAQNQLMWVQHMNSLKAQAEELVMTELIYS